MLRLLAWLAGPMLAKELVELARRWRTYASRVLLGACTLTVMWSCWSSWAGYQDIFGDHIATVERLAVLGQLIFASVTWLMYLAVYVLLPPMLCGVVAGERESHTLDLLFTTQLSDREIVLGKFGSRLVHILLLLASAVPMLTVVLMLGGVDLVRMLWVAAATAVTILYVAGWSIHSSCVCRTPLGSLIRTYMLLFVTIIGLPSAAFVLTAGNPGEFMYLVAICNPVFLFAAAQDPDVAWGIYGWFLGWHLLGYAILIAFSALLLVFAIRRLRVALPLRRKSQQQQQPAEQSIVSTPEADGLPNLRAMGAGFFAWGDNPLVARATAAPVYDRERYLVRLMWLIVAAVLLWLFGMLLLAARFHPFRDPNVLATGLLPLVMLLWLAVGLLVVLVSGTSAAGDRQRGLLELLLVTPMPRRQFVDGYAVSVWQHVWPAFALGWSLTGLMILAAEYFSIQPLVSAGVATLVGWLIILEGVVCSLAARRWTTALLAALAMGVLEVVGLAAFSALTVWYHLWWLFALLLPLAYLNLVSKHSLNPLVWTVLILTLFRMMVTCGLTLVAVPTTAALFSTLPRQYSNAAEVAFACTFPGWHILYPLGVALFGDPPEHLPGYMQLGPYVLSVVLSLVVLRAWAIWRFDDLVGRRPEYVRPAKRAAALAGAQPVS